MEESQPDKGEVTILLGRIREGNKDAESELLLLVYDELRQLAHKRMRQEGPGHTLQTTALVHEAYLRLLGDGTYCWQDRSHFFAVIAQTMRRVLLDYARARRAGKRGGEVRRVELAEADNSIEENWDDVILVNNSLAPLAAVDQRYTRIVELRFFAGLTVKATAELLAVSTRTVARDWGFVKAWL